VRASQLAALAYDCPLPLIADESCLTAADADILFGAEGRVWLNLRLAKNGGILPTARLARRAAEEKVPFVIGCLVGESGILSLAQRALLAAAPPAWAVEGNYGRWLLRDDLVVPSPRFGYGGLLHVTGSEPLSPLLRSDKLKRYARRVCRLDAADAGSDG
jgi:muconate cycloisomerase